VLPDQVANDFRSAGVAHDEPFEDQILLRVVNEVRVVQRIFCDQSQQIEVRSVPLAIGVRLLLDDIEEQAEVAMIATKLLDDLNHIGLPLRGPPRRPIGACYFPCSRSMTGGKVSRTPTARSTKAAMFT